MRALRLLLAAVAATSATPVLAQAPPAEPWIDAIPNLTPLVATYGVYALSLIFIFFAWRRATADLEGATTEKTRAHLARIHTAVVAVTLGLALTATAVWIYDMFFFSPRGAIAHVRGVVQGLTSKAGSRAYQAISFRQPPDTDFYYLNDVPPGRSEYQYKWALFTRESSPRLSFDLQLLRETTERSTAPDLSEPTVKTQTVVLEEGYFALKLDPLKHPPGKVIEIRYEPGDNQEKVGKILVNTGQDLPESIVFQRKQAAVVPAAQPWGSYLLAQLLTPVYAQTRIFEKDGDYERQVGDSLRRQLGSNSLQTQLAARAVLIQNGERAFKFISDSLEPAAAVGVDRALLVHNLSEALADIERGPDRFPSKGWLKLALAQYDVANYEASSRAFDRAGRDALGSDSLLFLKRGYAYQKSNRPREAQADYEQSISKADDRYAKAIAHNALATLYADMGRHADAEREYNAAIALDRRVLGIQNNLAYSYAERGVKLDEALRLIDGALKQDGENAGYLDTKGWVLFKQGKFKDALPYLERAQKMAPGDDVIDDHVRQARAALAKK
jgi:tetratricopeptide (TPR) repeat protein